MCVAVVVESSTPIPREDLQAMSAVNDDGAGIAWVEGDHVHYLKGINARTIDRLQRRIPRPFLLHFRYATMGRPTAQLTHPFPLGDLALDHPLRGTAPTVLIHNGTWRDADKYAPDDGIDRSDTQIAAWMAGYYPEILDQIPWSTATMHAAGDGRADIVMRGDWTEYNGNTYSNLHWKAERRMFARAARPIMSTRAPLDFARSSGVARRGARAPIRIAPIEARDQTWEDWVREQDERDYKASLANARRVVERDDARDEARARKAAAARATSKPGLAPEQAEISAALDHGDARKERKDRGASSPARQHAQLTIGEMIDQHDARALQASAITRDAITVRGQTAPANANGNAADREPSGGGIQ